MILSTVVLFVKLVLLPVFSALGLIYDLIFWPLAILVLWIVCWISLVLISFCKGEEVSKEKAKAFLFYGPFIWALWVSSRLLDYLGISAIGQAKKVWDYTNKMQESVKGAVKGAVKDTAESCKNTAASCKKTASSATTKAQETAKSIRDQVLAYKDKALIYKDQAVNFVKSKLKKAEKPEEKEDDKEDKK